MPQTLYPDVINNLKLFSGLSDHEKEKILRDGKIRWYERGHQLFRHGDPIQHFYIVCSGAMQLLRATPDGHEITTDVVIPGNTLCKREIFRDQARHHQVSAVVVKDVVVVEFPAAWLKKIAMENPVIMLNILSTLSQYAHMVEVEIEHKTTMNAAQQVACFLQRLCLMHGLDPQGFELPYSKSLIASRLGMEPETFSRTLTKLKAHGIEVTNSYVRFHDLEEIGKYVCHSCSMVDECTTHEALVHRDQEKQGAC